jgi:hypothetical protein
MLERLFAGSALKLVMPQKASRPELAEIRKLLNEMEGETK